MRNVDVKMVEGKLVITIDPARRLGPSSTGKTVIIATTDGAARLDEPFTGISMSLSVYTKEGAQR